jgi:hypothetical protein
MYNGWPPKPMSLIQAPMTQPVDSSMEHTGVDQVTEWRGIQQVLVHELTPAISSPSIKSLCLALIVSHRMVGNHFMQQIS